MKVRTNEDIICGVLPTWFTCLLVSTRDGAARRVRWRAKLLDLDEGQNECLRHARVHAEGLFGCLSRALVQFDPTGSSHQTARAGEDGCIRERFPKLWHTSIRYTKRREFCCRVEIQHLLVRAQIINSAAAFFISKSALIKKYNWKLGINNTCG